MISQKTDEWFEARLGKVTASRVHAIMGKGKSSEFSKSAETYAVELIAEEMTGFPTSAYGAALDWGNHYEPIARDNITKKEGRELLEVGFKYNESYKLGASADGVIMQDLTPIPVEIKCPFNSVNHIRHALVEGKDLPREYWWQVQTQILIYDAPYGYFYSFDPRNKANKLITKRIDRSEVDTNYLIDRVEQFIAYKNTLEEKINDT